MQCEKFGEGEDILQWARKPDKVQCEKCGEGRVREFCRNCTKFVCQVQIKGHVSKPLGKAPD